MNVRGGLVGLLSAVACSVAGCATPYQEMGFTGGVQATQITHNTFQVTARGNGYTDADAIQRYALRKAAETTLAAGFDWFAIGGEADRSRGEAFSVGNATAGRNWASAFSTTSSFIKPGQTVLITAFNGKPPEPTPPGVYDAHEIVQYVGGAAGFHGPTTGAMSDHRECSSVNGKVVCKPSS